MRLGGDGKFDVGLVGGWLGMEIVVAMRLWMQNGLGRRRTCRAVLGGLRFSGDGESLLEVLKTSALAVWSNWACTSDSDCKP
jgi:hypothetical protein